MYFTDYETVKPLSFRWIVLLAQTSVNRTYSHIVRWAIVYDFMLMFDLKPLAIWFSTRGDSNSKWRFIVPSWFWMESDVSHLSDRFHKLFGARDKNQTSSSSFFFLPAQEN